MGQTIREFDATQTMQFKCGFDALSGEVRGIAVTGDIPTSPIGGRETTTFVQVVETIEDFVKYLNISASASIQVAFARGGAKAAFAETLKFHDYSAYVVAYVSVKTGTKILGNPAFDTAAGTLFNSDQDTFRKRYGDEYLAAITEGGEFIGFLEIQTHDQTEQQNISGAINASGTFDSITGDASAQLGTSITKVVSNSSVKLNSFQRGGKDSGIDKVTVAALVSKATGFAATVTGTDVFDYEATFQTYDILTPPAGPNPIDVENQREALEQLGLYKLRYKKVLDSIQYVLDNPDEFEAFDSAALVAKQNGLNDFLNKLKDAASACFSDQTKCKFPNFLVDPDVTLPKRFTGDVRKAVAAAKDAMAKAQSFALACKTHADRVVAISHTIAAGPNGKALADEAKLESDSAALAANQAGDSANTAFNVGSTFTDASAFVAAAKVAADQAKVDAATASGLVQAIHDIGYAPFWKAPLVLVLATLTEDDGTIYWGSTSIRWDVVGSPDAHTLPLEKVAEDPSGGPGIDFVVDCATPQRFINPKNDFSTCTFKNYINSSIDVSYTTSLSNNVHRFFSSRVSPQTLLSAQAKFCHLPRPSNPARLD